MAHIPVSHTAFNSFMNSNSENYYSYISELKQWAGIKGKKIRIKDKKNSEITLKSYVDLDPDTEFDPIEIYAYYISNSQEARLNTMQLMEKLRPLWEDTENNREIYVNNIIILNLFNKEGDIVLNFELNIDLENLERILYNRIEKGVINFFEALRLSFKDKEAEGIKSINILLAGNSSKSRFVTEIFNKYIDLELKSANRNESIENKYFKLYPPLGSKLAYEIQQENGKILQEDKLESPTGKTGVAFGLIKCRKGGRIKVIDRNVDECEIRPIYYLGYERKGKLEVVIDKSIKYNEWKLFVDAAYEDFEVYYTNLPKATTNKLDINEVLRKKCRISQTSDTGYVYIRFVEPSVIEYVVAEEDGIKEEKYLSDLIKVSLGV